MVLPFLTQVIVFFELFTVCDGDATGELEALGLAVGDGDGVASTEFVGVGVGVGVAVATGAVVGNLSGSYAILPSAL
jgi:hypothetical protein